MHRCDFAQVSSRHSVAEARASKQQDSGKLQALLLICLEVAANEESKMMARALMILGLTIVAWATVGWAAVVQDQDTSSLRSSYEAQFESFDINGDGELSEAEVENVPDSDLAAMHAHGLPASIPIAREAFVTSGVATALAAIAGSDGSPMKATTEEKPGRETTRSVKVEPEKAKQADVKVTSTPAATTTRLPGRKTNFVPDLPSEFAVRDKNGDGQIALYEWDRRKYSEFVKLDKNNDGFLTPLELLPPDAIKSLYAKVAGRAPAAAPGTPATVAGTNVAVSATPGTPAADEVDKEARNIFGQMDQSKNGMIDEDEWGRSTRIRPSFERAGIKVSIPINPDTFVQHYRRSKEAERTERR